MAKHFTNVAFWANCEFMWSGVFFVACVCPNGWVVVLRPDPVLISFTLLPIQSGSIKRSGHDSGRPRQSG